VVLPVEMRRNWKGGKRLITGAERYFVTCLENEGQLRQGGREYRVRSDRGFEVYVVEDVWR
jgi:hypothetical protein